MSRETALIEGLRNKLLPWAAYIKRAAFATDVSFTPEGNGEFSIVVKWPDGEHKKLFDRATVFGRSMQLNPAAWSVQHCAGEFARTVVREVLEKRGV